MPKIDMKNTNYYKSGKHSDNVLAAQVKARIANDNNKQKRIDTYLQSPKCCANPVCTNILAYDKRKNEYCSKTCSAQINNIGRNSSLAKRAKQSSALKGRKYPGRGNGSTFSKVSFKTCSVCEKLFTIRGGAHKWTRKTCSQDCKTIASVGLRTYQNGSRKPIWYYNSHQGKEVLLDSSWEAKVASVLDQKSLRWSRPDPIKWIDSKNKAHLYWPDFYLIDYNIYLDPKNPYCMSLDTEKLDAVSKLIQIRYGSLDYIISVLVYLQPMSRRWDSNPR